MKQYLCFSRNKITDESGKRVTTKAVPRVRFKQDAYSDSIKVETFSVRSNHLILGADNAGKSRWISKLSKERNQVWKGKNTIAIRSVDALTDWYVQLPKMYRDGLLYPPKTSPERLQVMIDWLKGGVLLVDDIHRATGRKVDYLHDLISNAKIVVVSATSHQKIHPKLRHTVMSLDPQIHDLASNTAYDATQILIWLLVVVLVAVGAAEAAILLGGASLLRGGAKSRSAV